jgi:asparagine synthase (glutamine-hydrolysing)
VATGNIKRWNYWNLPEPETTTASPEELEQELETLLADAVKRQLVAADVPVGILLSGGVDSSLVTALAARVTPHVKTFTISFPGHAQFDESPYARIVARAFGTEHTELAAEAASVDILPQLARQYDEPIGDAAIVPTYLVSRLIRQHATVALGGDGGDELFGGYPHYSWLLRQERIRRLVPMPLRYAGSVAAAHLLPPGFRARNHLIGFRDGAGESIAHINLFFDRTTRRKLLGYDSHAERYRATLARGDHSLLRRATETDFRSTMVDGYLVKVDRASMLTSLEIRAPFLDHRLIDFAFRRVPDELKATKHERKILPRRIARRVLPRELDIDRKQGFTPPMASWFKEGWGDQIEDLLTNSIFDKRAVRSLLNGQRRGLRNGDRLFALTMFELWRREYRPQC